MRVRIMGQGGTDGIETYNLPGGYKSHVKNVVNNAGGMETKNYRGSQRYTSFNINSSNKDRPNYEGSVELRNIVTTAEIEKEVHITEAEESNIQSGLYFDHGYDAHDADSVVIASGRENVDLSNIAKFLIEKPNFELKISAHADTTGDATKNQILSENRLHTAEALLVKALEGQGLSSEEAQEIYDNRVAPHATVVAAGESDGPIGTDDNVNEQGNRVVEFNLFSETEAKIDIGHNVQKEHDHDNHEHYVVMHLGTKAAQESVDFAPEKHETNLKENQFSVADENTHFIIKIDSDRALNEKHEFTINYKAEDNLTADNTNFLIESNDPNAVTSEYNTETGNIDIKVNGAIALHINIGENIDPALIRVGSVTTNGHVTIEPVTNLNDVTPISEMVNTGERNNLTNAADNLMKLSVEAKHAHMKHGDSENYKTALKDLNFEERLDKILDELKGNDIDTEGYKALFTTKYMTPESGAYAPDEIVFPFQAYEGLLESSGMPSGDEHGHAYKALLAKIDDHTNKTLLAEKGEGKTRENDVGEATVKVDVMKHE